VLRLAPGIDCPKLMTYATHVKSPAVIRWIQAK